MFTVFLFYKEKELLTGEGCAEMDIPWQLCRTIGPLTLRSQEIGSFFCAHVVFRNLDNVRICSDPASLIVKHIKKIFLNNNKKIVLLPVKNDPLILLDGNTRSYFVFSVKIMKQSETLYKTWALTKAEINFRYFHLDDICGSIFFFPPFSF